ncbi:MAG: hypothetical protein J6C35_04850 [Bacteroidales bacterium]|nr:hypothetical protein [Bacteroidales bacterium]
MKNIFRYSILLALCSFIGLVSCTREEISTDQFSDDAVVFGAFAPNPVVRGAELRIMGSNLDKIVEVQIPGSEPITEIEVVSSGRVSEIRVLTPAAGAEDASVTGPVVITDNAGNTYQSMAELTFTEGIVLDSFSPANAMPGDEVTVKGDYLYNVQQIVLNNGVFVTGDQITAKSRRELKFIVPSNAVTGPVTIGDVDENNNPEGLIPNNVPSKEELVIGDPTVKAADRGAVKAGDQITVTGEYLNMIAGANFGGVAVDYTVAEDGKSLVAALPATAVDGDFVLVSYAGKEFNAGAYTTVIPTNVAIKAESRYKAGLNAVISGKDLDLVTGAALAGTTLEYAFADNKITFTIPAAAVDGTVSLSLANGKSVETEAIELVKPVVTGVSPLELYAGDEPVVVAGEDLDLVVSATLGGKAEEIEVAADGKSVKIATTVSSVSGKVTLALANGIVLEPTDEIKVNYHSLVIVSEMPAMQHIGEEVVLKGSNFSLVENIFIGETKVTQYSIRTDEEVRFLMPWNKVGMYNLSFHLFSGDVETVATQIEVGLEREFTTIWEGESFVTWSAGAVTNLSWGGYDWSKVKAGTTLVATVSTEGTGSVRFGNGSWAGLPSFKKLPGYNSYDNVDITSDVTYVSIVLTNDDLAELVNNGGFVLCGDGYTAHKIELITEISQEKDFWVGPFEIGNWNGNQDLAWGGFDWTTVSAGQILTFYCEPSAAANGGWYCISLRVGDNWGALNGVPGQYDNPTVVKVELTQEIIAHLVSANGLVMTGSNCIVNKITIL